MLVMDLYRLAYSFKLPQEEHACPYCYTDYLSERGNGSVCPFCESYIPSENPAAIDPAAAAELAGIKESMRKGAFLEAAENADSLSTNADPQVLYALSSFFNALSDITYWDVDYTLKAFMEKNADNRNDEPANNKYSAMHLYSKRRECLHKSIEALNISKQANVQQTFIKFMAEAKLGRYAHAAICLEQLRKPAGLPLAYANMVLSIGTKSRSAVKDTATVLQLKETCGLFYAAKHFAGRKEFGKALRLIDKLTSIINLPEYIYYRQKVVNVSSSAGI